MTKLFYLIDTHHLIKKYIHSCYYEVCLSKYNFLHLDRGECIPKNHIAKYYLYLNIVWFLVYHVYHMWIICQTSVLKARKFKSSF